MSSDFPKRLPEKLKTIRKRLGMTPDQFSPFVGAENGAQIQAYESGEGDLLLSVLWAYVQVNGKVTHAAKLLGVGYQTLAHMIERKHPDLLKKRNPVRRRAHATNNLRTN